MPICNPSTQEALGQEDRKFKASLSHMKKPWLRKEEGRERESKNRVGGEGERERE